MDTLDYFYSLSDRIDAIESTEGLGAADKLRAEAAEVLDNISKAKFSLDHPIIDHLNDMMVK
jgi:hypothetical protein